MDLVSNDVISAEENLSQGSFSLILFKQKSSFKFNRDDDITTSVVSY